MSNNFIDVSSSGIPFLPIKFPSGLFTTGTPGSNLDACLTSLNSTFGFDITPHIFDMEFIPGLGDSPGTFHGASGQIPAIGHHFELQIGDFLVYGNIKHADYTLTTNGTIFNVRVEDYRKQLRRLKLHSEDLGENIPSGVVSVAYAYRINHGLTDMDGDPSNPLIREYDRILEIGVTYGQILEAIDLAFSEDKSPFSSSDFPSIAQIEQNIGGAIDSLRWKFNLQPMDQSITRILQDAGYEWYWDMQLGKIDLINKKSNFDISENDILNIISEFGAGSGLNETKQIGFGQDATVDPTRFRLLGGHQQGFINSHLLSPIDGLDTSALDNNITFTSGWDRLTIGFFDHDGFYRTYKPREKELQMALAGIEQWAYFKIYQTDAANADPPGFGLPSDAGHVAAQHFTFQSRIDPLMPLAGVATGASESGIRLIVNRRDEEHNWVNAFYARVRDHAARHYGRSYIAEGILYNEASGLFRPIDAAWANVENQINGNPLSPSGSIDGPFIQDYEISRQLGPISPFVTDDFRVKAYCVLPADTVYGPQGDDVPASFGNWTEDAAPFNPSGDGRHYIPIELRVVGQRVINPRSDELYSFESYPDGTLLCQLPINAGPNSGLIEDNTIANLVTLLNTRNKLSASGLRDILNPAIVLNAYTTLSGVAIPVESRLRYGQGYPTTWVTGTLHFEEDEFVQLDDQFVPWAFSPRGSRTSLEVMTNRAMRRVNGKIIPVTSSRYADFLQVGLPKLSFDEFADQGIGPSGLYGEISHGVSELNISFGNDGFQTRYKAQSYFSKFGREAPLGERVRAQINGIINPIDFSSLFLDQRPIDPPNPSIPGDPFIPPIFSDDEQRAVRVTIEEINNVFTLDSPGVPQDERYRGRDGNEYLHPPPLEATNDPDFLEGAICVDGFLNIGDQALYHTDSFELPDGAVVVRYFTGGRKYGNGTIVQIEAQNDDEPENFDVIIYEPSNGLDRGLKNIPVLNGTVNIGDRTTLAVQGDGPIRFGQGTSGLFLNPSVVQGVVPVQITSITDPGTSGAIGIAQALDANGILNAGGTSYQDVIAIPYRQFLSVGDKGFLSQVNISGVTVNFFDNNKPGFFRFD